MNKFSLTILLIVVLAVGIIGGHSFWPQVRLSTAVSPAGSSNSTAKIASISIAPLTAAATSTSILNTDGTDRGVTSVDVLCTGLGTSNPFTTGNTGGATIAGLVLQTGTTSVANQGLQANTSLYSSTTIATSTTYGYVSTSTEGVIQTVSRIWPTNTYLTFQFNATSTGACTAAAKYLSL